MSRESHPKRPVERIRAGLPEEGALVGAEGTDRSLLSGEEGKVPAAEGVSLEGTEWDRCSCSPGQSTGRDGWAQESHVASAAEPRVGAGW